ncbi:MAG: lipid II flippase MurJ, partial [Cyanobacteria bacterium J06635_13]
TTPFKISIINIFLNATLDYFLIDAFGTPGLIMATVGVNIFSMTLFVIILHRRLNGLPLLRWSRDILGLFIATAIAGLASYGISQAWSRAIGNDNLLLLLLELSLASGVALIIFGLIAMQLRLPELNLLVSRIRQKLGR